MLLWYKIWLHNGYRVTHVKPKLHKKPRKVQASFLNRKKIPRWYIQTLPRKTSKLAKTETNGIAKKVVRKVEEDTSTLLGLSRLEEQWRADAMDCYCCLRNIQDLLAAGKTLHERSFEERFAGPIIPSGAKVEYHPITAKDKARLHQLGQRITRQQRSRSQSIRNKLSS